MDLGLGAGKIRFVPKERGLRMITNMKTATRLVSLIIMSQCVLIPRFFYQVSSTTDESFQEQKVNPNARLETALNVLHYEMVRIPLHHATQQIYKVYYRNAIQTSWVAQY